MRRLEKVKKVREGWRKLEKVGDSWRKLEKVGESQRRLENSRILKQWSKVAKQGRTVASSSNT